MGIRRPPKAVRYTERDGRTKRKGEVLREVSVEDQYPWGDYLKVLQEVKFEGLKEPRLRLGYYVKDHGDPESEYRWGSQTTLIVPKSKFLDLLEEGRREGIL